ncbi:MAG: SulP family inorganic anion transporter [Chloroflexota bacterium]
MTDSSQTDASPSPGAGGLQLGRVIPIITAGLVVAILEVVFAASLAALIFSGPLSEHVAAGIGLALFGGIVANLAVTLLGSLPGTVGGVQDAPAAILTVMAGAIVAAMPDGASGEAAFVTVAATIAITALLTGASLLAMGQFRLGNLVRFLPYPVVGGFLAGTGWLLFSGGLSMMTNLNITPADIPSFLQPDVLLMWLPGLLWTIVAFVAMRRFDHPLLLPGLIILGIVLFYLAAWLAGLSTDGLVERGLLLGRVPSGQMWPPLAIADLQLVQWRLVLNQALSIATIIILSMVGVLLNASGLEVTFRRDVNLNQELRAAGAGNLVAGLGAGFVGFQQLSGSALAFGLKGASRWTGVITTAVCALFLLFGGAALFTFPKAILGGLILLVGLAFLYEWLAESWSRLPRQDYAIIVIIVLTTAVVGFLEAVILGLLIAVILFAVSYSWANVIRAEMSGATYHSRVTRSRQQQALLDQMAEHLAIFQLQGFIFFGTAHTISDRVRQRISGPDEEKPHYIILDFSRVSGLDSTASISFSKIVREAGRRDVSLAIAAPKPAIWQQLLRAGLCEPGDGFKSFSSLDKGVEWCEEQLLAASGADELAPPPPMSDQLAQILGDSDAAASLMRYMQRLEVDAGQRIISQGDPAETMYFVESGRVTAQLARRDGEPVRLQSMASGNVVGEIGFYLGGSRTADVVAEEASVIYRLSLSDLETIQTRDPKIASSLHHLVAILLAERVAHLTAIVDSDTGHRR